MDVSSFLYCIIISGQFIKCKLDIQIGQILYILAYFKDTNKTFIKFHHPTLYFFHWVMRKCLFEKMSYNTVSCRLIAHPWKRSVENLRKRQIGELLYTANHCACMCVCHCSSMHV